MLFRASVCVRLLNILMSRINIFKSKALSKYINIYKKDGFKGVFKEGGWRVVGFAILFFLIKGVRFYIVIPYLIFKGIIF